MSAWNLSYTFEVIKMKFTKAPVETFKKLVMNAGVVLSEFNPTSATVADSAILAATTGGCTFQATPEYSDMADGIDNVPSNMMELMKRDKWAATLSGTFRTTDAGNVALQLGSATVSGDKVVPKADLSASDFKDIWLVADYSEYNGESNGGFVAIHLMNALSTGGFQLKTNDKGNGDMAFVFTAHYSMSAQDTVPFEVYVHSGTAEA